MKYAKSKYKPIIDYELVDDESDFDVPRDHYGRPMILPPEVWQNTVVNFNHLMRGDLRPIPRVHCTDPVVLYNKKGEIVAKGSLRDLNEKSSGIEIKAVDLTIQDYLYLEFFNNIHFVLVQVKVVLRRVQIVGSNLRVGVEFVEPTAAFKEKLAKFLVKKRRENSGFGDSEII